MVACIKVNFLSVMVAASKMVPNDPASCIHSLSDPPECEYGRRDGMSLLRLFEKTVISLPPHPRQPTPPSTHTDGSKLSHHKQPYEDTLLPW